jgi:hypothetical protein
MGELSETLDKFSKISKEFHGKIQKILRDKYCWKCPMRSTRKNTFCNELDAWIRLTGAFERGVKNNVLENVDSEDDLDIITSRYLSKLLKKHNRSIKYDKTIILKLKENIEPFALKGDLLFIKENPESVKVDDLIIWPQICPVSFYWFSKAKILGIVPFEILKVEKSFQKDGHRFILSENSLEIPLEYVAGKIVKIIGKNDSIYSKLDL